MVEPRTKTTVEENKKPQEKNFSIDDFDSVSSQKDFSLDTFKDPYSITDAFSYNPSPGNGPS